MFGWFTGSKLRAENDRLRAELLAVKAAATPAELVAGVGGVEGGMFANQASLTAAREQLRHFFGYQRIAIDVIAKRCAAQAIYVGYTPADSRGEMMTKAAKFGEMAALEKIPNHELLRAIDDPNEIFCRWQLLYVTL